MLRKIYNETQKDFVSYLAVTFFAICAHKILMTIHYPNADSLVDAAFGVVEGRPHWLAYQNRLLGPYTIFGISELFGLSLKTSWLIYNAIALQIFCVLFFWILRRERISIRDSFLYLITIIFSYLTLQHFWFYAWDSIDSIIFTLFAYGIFKAYSIRFFLVLFIVGILNRESALFIALYLILDAFIFPKGLFSLKLHNLKSLAIGITSLISGIIYTQYIRNLLFISKSDLTGGGRDAEHELIGNHIHLLGNIKTLVINFTNSNFIVSISLITTFLYFIMSYRRMCDRQLKVLIIALAMFANILMFGLVNETRIHLILLPFFMFLWISLNHKAFSSQVS